MLNGSFVMMRHISHFLFCLEQVDSILGDTQPQYFKVRERLNMSDKCTKMPPNEYMHGKLSQTRYELFNLISSRLSFLIAVSRPLNAFNVIFAALIHPSQASSRQNKSFVAISKSRIITQTCLCNILQFFTAVKMINFG